METGILKYQDENVHERDQVSWQFLQGLQKVISSVMNRKFCTININLQVPTDKFEVEERKMFRSSPNLRNF